MILHTCVSYEPRRASIKFGVKRSRLNLESLIFCHGGFPLKHVNFQVDGSWTEQLATNHPFQSLYRIILIKHPQTNHPAPFDRKKRVYTFLYLVVNLLLVFCSHKILVVSAIFSNGHKKATKKSYIDPPKIMRHA